MAITESKNQIKHLPFLLHIYSSICEWPDLLPKYRFCFNLGKHLDFKNGTVIRSVVLNWGNNTTDTLNLTIATTNDNDCVDAHYYEIKSIERNGVKAHLDTTIIQNFFIWILP